MPDRFEYGPEFTLTGAWQNEVISECSSKPPGYNRVCGFGPVATDSYLGPDLNGDGRGDLLVRVQINDYLEAKQCANTPLPPECLPIRVGDYLTLFATGNVSYATSSITLDRVWDSTNGPFRSPQGNIAVGNSQLADLNADGLLDLIDFGEGTNDFDKPIQYRLNTGSGFSTAFQNAFPVQTNVRGNSFADVDGDGRADLVAQSTVTGVLQKASFTRPGQPFTAYAPVAGGNAKLCGTASCTNAASQSQYIRQFADIDGDGGLDFLSFRVAGGGGLYVSRAPAGSRYRPRDVIEAITNGYGATTSLNYQPLTNKAIYLRDFNSRLDADKVGATAARRFLGRGSPVIDLLAPIYVVARADSSAPRFGEPSAVSRTRYRYTGLKVQSGGRGALGFRTITSIDDNSSLSNPSSPSFIATTTTNRQDFPYVGAPISTVKMLVQGVFSYDPNNINTDLNDCAVNMEANGRDCFYRPPADVAAAIPDPAIAAHSSFGGVTIASAGQIWACKGFGSSESCEFINPTQSSQCIFEGQSINLATRMNVQSDLRVLGGEIDSGNFKVDSPQQPLFAFVAGTNEPMFDAFDGSVSMNQFSGACYDNLGNNTLNAVDTYTDAAANNRIERKRTDNIYSNLAGTAGGTFRWRLGRMTASNVTHTRQNPAQLGQTLSETRALAFSYDTGVISSTAQPNTGFLKSERSQQTAADAAEDVRTQHFRDVFGNVTIKMSCSREVPLSDCDDPTDISKVIHRPTREGKTLEWVHRYAETRFDTRLSPALQRGRFADESIVPYFDGTTSGNSTAAVSRSKVLARNAFGDAIQTTDLNGVDQVMAYGALGRMYYQWTETVQNSNLNSGGVTSTTRLRWCGSQANEVSCPTGAIFRQSVISNLGQASFTYFDVLGRELLSSSLGFNDPQDASIGGGASFNAKQFVAVCKFHEAHGRNSRVSEPFFLSDTPTTPGEPRFSGDPCAARDWTITQYDGLGREKQTIYPDGGTKTVSYGKAISPTASPLSTRTVMTQSAGVQLVSTITKNALGEIVQTIDDAGLVADFDYDIQGNQIAMRRTSDVQRAEVKTTMQYDRSGRKISEFDPDSGGSSTRYNALGEVIRVTDAKGQISENHYDALGRVWKRIATGAGGGGDLIMKSGFEDGETPSAPSGGNSYTDVFTFDTANNGLGQLASEQRSGSTTYFRSFSFDSLGRPSATNTSFDAANYSESTSYDSFGRVLSITDATGGTLAHRYSARGYMYQLYELASGQIYYQVIEQDARGNVLREQKHGSVSLQTVRNYEPQTGRLLSIQSGSGGSIQSLNYEYDLLDNLTRRQDLRAGHSERFEYDRLNRLTRSFLDRVNNVNVGQINTFTASFDALGNICQKNGNGYGYDGAAGCGLHGSGGFAFNQSTASPHAVKAAFGFTYGYDANGNQTLRSGGQTRSIDYDVDDLATQITLGNEQTRFSYGPGGSRYRRLDLQNNAVQKTTRYVGNVEIVFGSQCETKRFHCKAASLGTDLSQPVWRKGHRA